MNPFAEEINTFKPRGESPLKKVVERLKKHESKESLIATKIPYQDKILALDVATNTGFCTRSGSGTWNLSPKKDESKGMRLIRFKAKLKDICTVEAISLVVFEGAVSYGKFPNMVGAEMIGVLKLFCEENSIEYRSYMPTEIKKSATGKGNAKKDMMVKAAQEKYNMVGNDDNQADALHLYHHALKDLGI